MNHLIAPSLLAADFGKLHDEIEMLNRSEADWIHVDIMDGVFVPNISFGFPVMEVLKAHAGKPLDVHLMIVDPDRYLSRFRDAGAANITVHYEACTHLHRTVHAIRELGCTAGVALNPHTPVSALDDVLDDLDLVLLMSVNPGFGGQKFIRNTYKKIRQVVEMAAGRNENLFIEVDGGVNLDNAPVLIETGANVLVAGNFVFSGTDPEGTISALRNYHPGTLRA
jgi:ribulose-phosphate 3-epimerase